MNFVNREGFLTPADLKLTLEWIVQAQKGELKEITRSL